MKSSWIICSIIATGVAIIMGLTISFSMASCIPISGITAGLTSAYPADIGGSVIIAEKVECWTLGAVPPGRQSDIFWIVDISVKNNSYNEPVEADFEKAYKGWVITVDDKVYRPEWTGRSGENPLINLSVGQTGRFMLHFSVPKALQVGDAQICYQGQAPYSYGNFSFSEKVSAYDWISKSIITEAIEVEDWRIQLDSSSWQEGTLTVKLTITNLGLRRNFGYAGFNVGPELAVIDSTGKLVEPWVPLPDTRKGVLFNLPPYTREFYPKESWSGSLKFEMSPYSGMTSLYMTRFYHARKYLLFDLGEPGK